MSNIDIRSAKRPDWDKELVDIADYVCNAEIDSDVADGPNSVILQQVTNGVAVRMAVLYLLAGGDSTLCNLGGCGATVRELVEAGQLRTVIDHAVDFEDAGFAVDEVETGSPRGKIVISGFGREAPID